MGKFLRVLIFVLLALCIAALMFGILLFNKREILKGRAQRLEKAIKEFDAVIEAAPGTMNPLPSDLEKDISPCQAEMPDQPEYNDFWKTKYNYNLEVQTPEAMVSTSARDQELMTYFTKDAAGNKRNQGPGTMDGVLRELLKHAEAQYNLLNATRQQLSDLRQELIATIRELNSKKNDHRQALIKIKELEEKIIRLEAEIEPLKNKIAELEAQIVPLKDTIVEQGRLIVHHEETISERNREIETLKKNLGDARSSTSDAAVWHGKLEAGIKGEVLLVNDEWKFIIFRIYDSFMQELIGDNPDAEVPQVDLWVKRPDKAATIVTKIRMLQVRKDEKLATADVLVDWQQMSLKVGDLVFFE